MPEICILETMFMYPAYLSSQISTSEVEFWDPVSKHLMMDMMSRGRYHLYPPRFTIQACGVSALTTTCMTVSFKGFKEEVEIGVILPFRSKWLSYVLNVEE